MRKAFLACVVILLLASSINAFCDTQLVPSLSLRNTFLLLTPLIVWNIALTRYLPLDSYFPGKAPTGLLIAETVFRIFTFTFPIFLSIEPGTTGYRIGLPLYLSGTALYFASWLGMIWLSPDVIGSNAILRYAPAFLPVVVFSGMAAMSDSVWYGIGAAIFTLLHVGEYLLRDGEAFGQDQRN